MIIAASFLIPLVDPKFWKRHKTLQEISPDVCLSTRRNEADEEEEEVEEDEEEVEKEERHQSDPLTCSHSSLHLPPPSSGRREHLFLS